MVTNFELTDESLVFITETGERIAVEKDSELAKQYYAEVEEYQANQAAKDAEAQANAPEPEADPVDVETSADGNADEAPAAPAEEPAVDESKIA
jgi:hypothetical protein